MEEAAATQAAVVMSPTNKRTSPTRERLVMSNRDDSRAERDILDNILFALHRYDPLQHEDAELHEYLRELGYDSFFPWLNPVKEANKVYFAKQEGALEMLISFVDNKYSTFIRYYAICCLWNYASTDEMARILFELGALEAVITQLNPSYSVVVGAAVGCLWGYLEFEDAQEQAVKVGVSDTLVALAGQLDQINEDEHTCLIGCLLCLAFNPKCRRRLVERNAPQSILAATSSADKMVRYVSVIFLAMLTLDPESEDQMLALGTLAHVSAFLQEIEPKEIAELDREQGMVWKFLRPFFSLMSSRHAPVRQLSGFIFATLSQTPVHQPLFKDEELLDELLAIRASTSDARLQGYIDIAVSFLRPLGMDAPSLVALSAYRLRANLQGVNNVVDQPGISTLPEHLHERFAFVTPL